MRVANKQTGQIFNSFLFTRDLEKTATIPKNYSYSEKDNRYPDVEYYYYQKDSNGYLYDRVGIKFLWKFSPVGANHILTKNVSLPEYSDDNIYLLFSEDKKIQYHLYEKEYLENFIPEEDHKDYIKNNRNSVMMSSILNSLHEDLLIRAINRWGNKRQSLKLVEEGAELIKAIMKVHNMEEQEYEENLKEELVDCIILCKQLTYHYGEKALKPFIDAKMEKLKNKLDK